jgi:metal-responsive CopG/Arc/MetJ family transcriptional regulator
MKAIQVVMDADLLERLDKSARAKRLSRSELMRHLLETALDAEQMLELVEADRRGYARQPMTPKERKDADALSKAQERVMARLAREDPW